jgi:hypothetical protein
VKGQAETIYKDYLTALEDSAKIECEANPEGFRSSIDDAKKQFSELADLRKSLKELVKIELREILIDLKSSV